MSAFDILLEKGLSDDVAAHFDNLCTNSNSSIKVDDFDDRAIDSLKELDSVSAMKVLDQFASADHARVSNKSAYLAGMVKTQKLKLAAGVSSRPVATSSTDKQKSKVEELLERTGYKLEVSGTTRKYGGPPPGWEGSAPGTGDKSQICEVFIGRLPRDVFEDTLVPLLEQCGKIYELRILFDPATSVNRGFAFCTFSTKEEAKTCVQKLDKYTLNGKTIAVCLSQPNVRLFISPVPKSRSKEDVLRELKRCVDGVTDIILHMATDGSGLNRGFVFADFEGHREAGLALKKLTSGKVSVFGKIPHASWAEPLNEADEEEMAKVKILFVKNLSDSITGDRVKELFQDYGEIEFIKRKQDYAFVHFKEIDASRRALEEMNQQVLEDDKKIDVSLAIPKKNKRTQPKFSGPPGKRSRGDFQGSSNYSRSSSGSYQHNADSTGGARRYDSHSYSGGYGSGYGSGYGGGSSYGGGYGGGYDHSRGSDSYGDSYNDRSYSFDGYGNSEHGRGYQGYGSRSYDNDDGYSRRYSGSTSGRSSRGGRGAPRTERSSRMDSTRGSSAAATVVSDEWSPKPIAQQPLGRSYQGGSYSSQQDRWYQNY